MKLVSKPAFIISSVFTINLFKLAVGDRKLIMATTTTTSILPLTGQNNPENLDIPTETILPGSSKGFQPTSSLPDPNLTGISQGNAQNSSAVISKEKRDQQKSAGKKGERSGGATSVGGISGVKTELELTMRPLDLDRPVEDALNFILKTGSISGKENSFKTIFTITFSTTLTNKNCCKESRILPWPIVKKILLLKIYVSLNWLNK